MKRSQKQQISVCPRCGGIFLCNPAGVCWCSKATVKLETLNYLKVQYSSCLCLDCLNDVDKKQT
ncbi:MAG TPA: cysteine-rich CWC family protein, partial [Bacteroidales bacterium]|nr:cysteine-rich CWC family protein [Bacteroidales bacterium]